MTPQYMILGSFLLLIVIGLLNVWVNKREKRIIQERAEERAREAAEDRARYQEYLKEQENAEPPGGRCPKCHLNAFETRRIGRQYEGVMFGTCGECGLDMSYLECGTCPSCGSDDYFMGSYTEGDNSGRCYACGETHANAIQWVAELEPEPLRIHSAGLFPDENDEADAMDADDAGDSADR